MHTNTFIQEATRSHLAEQRLCDVLAEIVGQRSQTRRVRGHKLLSIMPAMILTPGKRAGKVGSAVQRTVRRRIGKFREGEFTDLIEESERLAKAKSTHHLVHRTPLRADAGTVTDSDTPSSEDASDIDPGDAMLFRATQRLVQHGQLSRASNRLTSHGIAPPTTATADKLKAKHPHPPPINEFDRSRMWSTATDRTLPTQAMEVDCSRLTAIIMDAPKQSTPSITGWRMDHIQQLILGAGPHLPRLMDLLSRFIAELINADVPLYVQNSWMRIAPVIALNKDRTADADVRPIVLYDSFFKIAERYVVTVEKAALVPLFQSVGQLGAPGLSGGIEAAAVSHRIMHDMAKPRVPMSVPTREAAAAAADPDAGNYADCVITVSTDIFNAFNTLSRKAAAAAIREHLPHLLPYTRMLYDKPFHLWFGIVDPSDGSTEVTTILSRTGTLQGSALAQLIFDLAFVVPLQAVRRNHPGVLVTAIHDDVNMTGPPSMVAAAYITLERECKKLDLIVRPSKCHASIVPRQLAFRDLIVADFQRHGITLGWDHYPYPHPPPPPPSLASTLPPPPHFPTPSHFLQTTDGVTIGGTPAPVGTRRYIISVIGKVITGASQLSIY